MKDLTKHKTQADKCPRNYDCLNKTGSCLCEVNYCINNQVLFVKADGVSSCPYQMSYGYSIICNCPIRMLIYQETKNKGKRISN